MKLAELDKVLGAYATAMRDMVRANSGIADLMMAEAGASDPKGPNARALMSAEAAFEAANMKLREVEHWMRDCRTFLIGMTSEAAKAAADAATQAATAKEKANA